jgi:hypothetical protein
MSEVARCRSSEALREALGVKELPSLMFHQTEEIKEEPKEAA